MDWIVGNSPAGNGRGDPFSLEDPNPPLYPEIQESQEVGVKVDLCAHGADPSSARTALR